MHLPAEPNPTAAAGDLQAMLQPLRSLPDLYIHPLEDGGRLPSSVGASLELELDAEAPHLDFVRQLLADLRRVAEYSGVVLEHESIERLHRIAHHAAAVHEATAGCRAKLGATP